MTRNFPYLTHPYVLLALALTFVNDHYLKYAFPGLLTGKISDFTGLFFFPLFACAAFEFCRYPGALHTSLTRRKVLFAIAVTDVTFLLLKFTPLRQVFAEIFSHYFFTVQIVADPTDLVALSANFFTYMFAKRYFNQLL